MNQNKGPAGIADEAKIQKTKGVSDYESPLSSEKVTPIPKYPVMALAHILMDPGLAQGIIKFKRICGTPNQGFHAIIEYDKISCILSVYRSE